MKTEQARGLTAWGKEDVSFTPRVRKFIFTLFSNINRFAFYCIIFSMTLNALLLTYVVFGVEHSEGYAVDGTSYSCKLPTIKGTKK